MIIEKCYVNVGSSEEFKKVEEVCFENGYYWCYSGKNHQDVDTARNSKTIMIGSKCIDSYSSVSYGEAIPFNEFMNRLRYFHLNSNLYKRKKMELNQNNTTCIL